MSRAARGGGRAPQIRDVAARAGVGVATVSRVLNGSSGVAPATRDRVLAAIEETGYHPSTAARSLSLGRTQTIGVVAPFFTTPSVVERLHGISSTVSGSSYDLLIFDVETADQRADAFRGFIRSDRVDGVIVVSLPIDEDEAAVLTRDGLEAVLVDRTHPEIDGIEVDDRRGGRLAAEHLLSRGHERVAFIGDEPDAVFAFDSSERRMEGFREAMREAGRWPDVARYARLAPHGAEQARASTHELLELDPPPTAIFAVSDVQALGVLRAARERGIRVPEQLSVIGFDDIETAGFVGLTTVRQPLRESGRLAAVRLLAALDGGLPRRPERLELELEVVARETVATI